MADEGRTVVHEESDEASARIVAGFLQSNGIETTIFEDDAGDQIPSFEETLGVQVLVPTGDAERARKLLKERET